MSKEQQANGHDQQPQEGVSRETLSELPPELRVIQRVISAIMRKAENLCESAATLTDQVFIPVLMMVEVKQQIEPGVTQLGQCLVSGPQGVPNDKLVMLLKEVTTNISMAMEAPADAPPADAPETEDAPPLGDEQAAQQAMRQAMQDPEA